MEKLLLWGRLCVNIQKYSISFQHKFLSLKCYGNSCFNWCCWYSTSWFNYYGNGTRYCWSPCWRCNDNYCRWLASVSSSKAFLMMSSCIFIFHSRIVIDSVRQSMLCVMHLEQFLWTIYQKESWVERPQN